MSIKRRAGGCPDRVMKQGMDQIVRNPIDHIMIERRTHESLLAFANNSTTTPHKCTTSVLTSVPG
jgi:hypothetical protein